MTDSGFTVATKWECYFKASISENTVVKTIVNSHPVCERLNLRLALFGCRINDSKKSINGRFIVNSPNNGIKGEKRFILIG